MRKPPPPLAFGQIAILHAIAAGNRFGFDIMDATGLTSGTVYPTLDRFESLGYVTSHWRTHAPRAATSGRPAATSILTAAGATARSPPALQRYKNLKPVSLAAWRIA